MMVSNLKVSMTVLLSVVCAGGTAVFHAQVMGQPPAAEQKGGNAKVAPEERQRDKTDKDRLQGRWQIVSIAMEDKVVKSQDLKNIDPSDVLIAGDRLGQAEANKGNTFWKGKLKLDDTRNPKQITIQDEEGKLTFRGIYSIDGDAFKLCINGDGTDVRRPEEFVTKKGSAVIIITFKKVQTK